MSKPTGNDRARASKLRLMVAAGRTLTTDDATWFKEYETARAETRASKGASATKSHTVEFRESSHEAAAVGEGDAAVSAASAAQVTAMVKEEGRREDNLARLGIEALKVASDTYKSIVGDMVLLVKEINERQKSVERSQIKLMAAWRYEFLTRTHGDAEAIIAEARAEAEADGKEDDGGIGDIGGMLVPVFLSKMGIDPNMVAAFMKAQREEKTTAKEKNGKPE